MIAQTESATVESVPADAGPVDGGCLAFASSPPSLLGGADSHNFDFQGRVCVHWLQGTIPADRVFIAIDILRSVLPPGEEEELAFGRNGYDAGYMFHPYGVQVWWDRTVERSRGLHGGRACVSVPGQALDAIGGEAAYRLMQRLIHKCWFLATRVDVAFDDYRRVIEPCQLVEIAERGDFSGYRRWEHVSPRRLGGEREGDMIRFGRRGRDGSGRFLRVYDKALESGGEVNCIRWEVEFSKERAREVVLRLSECSNVEAFAGLVASLVGGSIDFVKRTQRVGDKNLDRLERYAWWDSLLQMLGRVKFVIKRRPANLERAKTWVEESVCVTLAMCRSAVGDDDFFAWLEQCIGKAQVRMKARHYGAIDAYVSNPDGWFPWARAG